MDKTKALTLGILSIVLMLALLVFSLVGGEPDQKVQQLLPPAPPDCGPLILSCRAESSVKLETCSIEKAQAKLFETLGAPLSHGECATLKARLPGRCPTGCELDYSSIMTIPGRIAVEGSGRPDESERCQYRGSRQVSVRAMCKPRA